MDELLENIESMLAMDAERRGLEFQIENNVRAETYLGDNVRLRQVILNLLSNAFKFTYEGGSVTLRVDGAPAGRTDQVLTVQVIDTGVGIAPESQERVFQSFEQVGTSTSKSMGTGLGLPISRSIVRLMGGDLLLYSELGRGSTFYFTITLPFGEHSQQPELCQKTDMTLHGVRILFAEDNDLNAEIAMELLGAQGAGIQRVENGKLAVERFEASTPGEFQAILMDIQMPEMNGLNAAKAIRSLDRSDAQTIPIIAMTANSFQEDVDAALAAGMSGFVSKPVDINVLFRELHRTIRAAVRKVQ